MESQVTGSILSVSGRTVGNNKTIYDIAFSDGNTYSTFDGALAQKAGALQGQQVSANVKVEKKGNYTNFYFNDVAPVGTLAAPSPAAGTPVAGIPIQGPQNGTSAQSIPINQGDPQKDARISKGVAVKVAGEVVAGLFQGAGGEALPEVLEAFDKVGKHVLGVLTGAAQVQQQAAVVPTEQTPEAVAEAVNAAAGQEVVIPWGATA